MMMYFVVRVTANAINPCYHSDIKLVIDIILLVPPSRSAHTLRSNEEFGGNEHAAFA